MWKKLIWTSGADGGKSIQSIWFKLRVRETFGVDFEKERAGNSNGDSVGRVLSLMGVLSTPRHVS
jgi:hypothetical protein